MPIGARSSRYKFQHLTVLVIPGRRNRKRAIRYGTDRYRSRHLTRKPSAVSKTCGCRHSVTTSVIVDDLHIYLEARLRQVSAKGKLAEAIRYALSRCLRLSLFLDDGRVEMDSNTVERLIRQLTLNPRTRSSQARTRAATTRRSSPR